MRVAHCSDPHLLSVTGVRGVDFVNKRWIGGLELLTTRRDRFRVEIFQAMVADFNRMALDHVVVTGDITNVALEAEFRLARRLLDSIDLGPDRVTVLPGNHDAYVARGVHYFSTYLDEYHRPDPEWTWSSEPPGERWPVVRLRGPLAVVAVSTSLVTPWFTAWGRVGTEQLARLRTVLDDPRLAGRFRLIAIHHPPAGSSSASPRRGLRDRSSLADVVGAAGAELVLHGHEHRDVRAALPVPGGAVAVRGIPSASYEAGRPVHRARYRIYEITNEAAPAARPTLVREIVRVWSPTDGEFFTEVASAIDRPGDGADSYGRH
jgi:3',5'-cyclic AMP phosphodiesterase CpdA